MKIKVTNPFTDKALTNVHLMAEGRRLARVTVVSLGVIAAGGHAMADVAILPKARAQPLASPNQNTYQLALTLSCAEVNGIYAAIEVPNC